MMRRFLPPLAVLGLAAWAWWQWGRDPGAGADPAAAVRAEDAASGPAREAVPDSAAAALAAEAAAADARRLEALRINQRGLEALKEGRAETAEELIAAAVEMQPDDPTLRRNLSRVRVQLARAAMDRGRYDEAATWLDRAEAADADAGVPAEWRVRLALRRGRRAEAERLVAEALARWPESDGLLRLAGELAFLRGDLDEAVARYEAALARRDEPATRERLAQLRAESELWAHALTDHTAHFDSRFDPRDPEVAPRIGELEERLEAAWRDVVAAIGVQPAQRLLVLWASPESWSGPMPEWSKGFYDGRVRILVGGDDEHLDETLRHELVHAALHALGGDYPTWLHEGLAQRIQGVDVARVRSLLRERAPLELPVSALDADWSHWKSGEALVEAYGIALSLVDWLTERYGETAVQELVRRTPDEGFEAAWNAVFLRPFAEVEAEHRAWLTEGS